MTAIRKISNNAWSGLTLQNSIYIQLVTQQAAKCLQQKHTETCRMYILTLHYVTADVVQSVSTLA